jgi:hypothetical protein
MRHSLDLMHEEAPTHSKRVTNRSVIPLAGVAVYIVTGIIYIFESGSPQPADFTLMVTIMISVLIVWRRYPSEPVLYFASASFLIWVLLVNGVWYLSNGDPTFIRKTAFYFYNMTVFLFTVSLCYHDFERLKTVLYWSLLAALLIQIVAILVLPSGGATRSIGTFNNPNQLGYWGLLVLACFGLIKDRKPLSLLDIGMLVAAGYVIIRSLSKAASISGALLIAMIVLFCGWRRGSGLLLAAILVAGVVTEVATGGYLGVVERFTKTEAISNINQRLSSIGEQSDDSIEGRGYYRITDNLELMAFGAGEGDFARLDRDGDAKEFHSTPGNIIVSYGVVGVGLFLFFLFVVFRRAPLTSLALFAPLMLYGITHNGIRGSLLWFFLALVYAQSFERNRGVEREPS